MRLTINGNNNTIIIGENVSIIQAATIRISKDCENGRITIGNKTTIWNADILNSDDSSEIIIGENCMISRDVVISNTDEHAILVANKVINHANRLAIGNHVWIGMHASIMKNSVIPDGCIVGRCALVCGRFEQPCAVLAGVPARVVKTGVDWSRKTVNEFRK